MNNLRRVIKWEERERKKSILHLTFTKKKTINKQTNNGNHRNGTKQTTEKLYLTWMQLPKNQFIYREIL